MFSIHLNTDKWYTLWLGLDPMKINLMVIKLLTSVWSIRYIHFQNRNEILFHIHQCFGDSYLINAICLYSFWFKTGIAKNAKNNCALLRINNGHVIAHIKEGFQIEILKQRIGL